MSSPHELGRRGEDLAVEWLEARGWTVLARNFRLGHKEIDIVARRGDLVAFVEVKTRAGLGFGHPLEAITRAKRREIERVATAWIARHGRHTDLYRFDAIGVVWADGASPAIEHLEGAWVL